jgi:AAA domain
MGVDSLASHWRGAGLMGRTEQPVDDGPMPWERGEVRQADIQLELEVLGGLCVKPGDLVEVELRPVFFSDPLLREIFVGIERLVADGETKVTPAAILRTVGHKTKDVIEGVPWAKTWGELARKVWVEGGLTVSLERNVRDLAALWQRREAMALASYSNGAGPAVDIAAMWQGLETLRRDSSIEPLDITLADEAVAALEPPDYIIDGILQRGFLYAMTAQTGHGKTALALRLAACVARHEKFGRREVEPGSVLYFAGENPTDVKMRLKGMQVEEGKLGPLYVSGRVSSIGTIARMAEGQVNRLGGMGLIIVDTSAAYFTGDEENSNTQSKNHASDLRRLTKLPGNPCVVVLCHPKKDAVSQKEMVPRGGSAFVAEIDGNMTAVKAEDGTIELWHTDKWRGPGFASMQFKLKTISTQELVDSKGRMIPTVSADWINRESEDQHAAVRKANNIAVLRGLLDGLGTDEIARGAHWFLPSGEADRKKVHRICREALAKARLVAQNQDNEWKLTPAGLKEAERLRDAGQKETQARARHDARYEAAEAAAETWRIVGPAPGERCAHCGRDDGIVFLIRHQFDGVSATPLHERCASAWFDKK